MGCAYDLLGNRTGLTYLDGRTVTYTYDMDNRLIQVEDWHGGLTLYEYDGIGRLITTTLPNQVIAQNSYDAAHHLTQLRYTGPDETLLAEFQYLCCEKPCPGCNLYL